MYPLSIYLFSFYILILLYLFIYIIFFISYYSHYSNPDLYITNLIPFFFCFFLRNMLVLLFVFVSFLMNLVKRIKV